MTNDEIISKMGKLQLAFRTANPTLYNALEKSIIPLIEYQCDLNGLSAKEIGRINGVGAKSAELISRLISGESVHSIVKSIPKRRNGRLGECKWKW